MDIEERVTPGISPRNDPSEGALEMDELEEPVSGRLSNNGQDDDEAGHQSVDSTGQEDGVPSRQSCPEDVSL